MNDQPAPLVSLPLAFARQLVAFALMTLVVLSVVSGLSLYKKGQDAMRQSDAAFHAGLERDAVVYARRAALSYVPGAEHVEAARMRLEAVARGAEAGGEFELAQFSWGALRMAHLDTDYPGRATDSQLARAEAGLRRLRLKGESPP